MANIHDHAQAVTESLGGRLHAMRESRGWTLENLADRAELSRAYLSRLEGGDRQPSLAALCAIAGAFGVSVAALFEQPDPAQDCIIVRKQGAVARTVNHLEFVPLSASTQPFNLRPIAVTIPAHRPGDETYQHDGEEWVHVLSGQVRLAIDGDEHVLEPGDSAHFNSRRPHRLSALGGNDAQIILVACPIPVSLNAGTYRAALAEDANTDFIRA
ncbi:MAG TPA: XRE family transcriptional regulator [Tepidisphaeraceae bacterium]|jgi:transcriptional regulator with XRE-family HTH domain|nr:XRE family transcriptional regulator [Tepidisphaeraceae bacterium]